MGMRLVTATPISEYYGMGQGMGMPDYGWSSSYTAAGRGSGDPFTYCIFDSEHADNDGTSVGLRFEHANTDDLIIAVEHVIFLLIEGYNKC